MLNNLPSPVPNKEIQILRSLLSADDNYVSGNDLADQLGISRVAIWSHMEKMRSQGFDFEAIRSKGYRMTAMPKELNASLVQALLTSAAGQIEIEVHDEIDSTNSEAERLLANDKPAPFAIMARQQSSGRGRLGRVWHSPQNGNLYVSFAFRPLVSPARLSTFTLWMGLNICEAINEFCGIRSNVKWPNDLQIDGKKVAGILTEARMDADQTRELVLGIGLNINAEDTDWPEELKAIATTIRTAAGTEQDINRVAAALTDCVVDAYQQFLSDEHRATFKSKWQTLDALRGKQVSLMQGEARISGKAAGIDSHGALIVVKKDGTLYHARAGEVTLEKQAFSQ